MDNDPGNDSEITGGSMGKKTILTMIILIIIIIIAFIIIMSLFLGRRVSVTIDKNVEGLNAELQDIFYLASFSPNSHNTQSWRVTVYPKDNRITLRTDESRRLQVVDPDNRELYISLGCYAETLIQAFAAYGYDTECSYDTNGHQCVISYKKTGSQPDVERIELIKKRHTDKRPFIDGRSIDKKIFDECLGETGNICFYDESAEDSETIRSATLSAYKKQAFDKNAADELSVWLRFSDRETLENKDGLPAELLGIYGFKKFLYYIFTNHENAKGDTFASQGVDTCEKQIDNCSGFIIVSGENDEASLFECGRETLRLWLALTKNDIAVQPLSYALEDDEYKRIIASIGAGLTENDSALPEPQMLLRVGYVEDYGENAGIRRDLSDYIIVED